MAERRGVNVKRLPRMPLVRGTRRRLTRRAMCGNVAVIVRGQGTRTRVDSSAVMINASTRLNDGGQFGLGAEIGISTDKFHARGPCGIHELTSYKYVAYGSGQLRQ